MSITNTGESRDKIILGIDPGTAVMGYGLLHASASGVQMLAMGVIDLRRVADAHQKLGRIHERMNDIIDTYHPHAVAIEAPFCGKNVQSMLKLGRAQGVAIAAAVSRGLSVSEYSPSEIKRAVTGSGRAGKEQVAGMVRRILHLDEGRMLPYADATDALAAAYCHLQNALHPGCAARPGGVRTWAAFARLHAARVSSPAAPRTTIPGPERLNVVPKKSRR